MPKEPPLKSLKGPIATRTRHRLAGSLRDREQNQRLTNYDLRSKVTKSSKSSKLRPPMYDKEAVKVENESGGMDGRQKTVNRRCTRQDHLDSDCFQFEPSRRALQQRAQSNKVIRRSLIQLVKFTPFRGKRGDDSDKAVSKRRRNGKKPARQTKRSRAQMRKKRGRVSRKSAKRSTRVRKQTRSKRRSTRSNKKQSGGQRRSRTTKRRTQKRKKTKQRRRRRKVDFQDTVQRRKDGVPPGPSLSHERDHMLNEQAKVFTENMDQGHDEVKDDPLNVNTLWRTLVKSLPGIPAEGREVDNEDKTDHPELHKDKDKDEKGTHKPKAKGSKRYRKKTSHHGRGGKHHGGKHKHHKGRTQHRKKGRGGRRYHHLLKTQYGWEMTYDRRKKRNLVKSINRKARRVGKKVGASKKLKRSTGSRAKPRRHGKRVTFQRRRRTSSRKRKATKSRYHRSILHQHRGFSHKHHDRDRFPHRLMHYDKLPNKAKDALTKKVTTAIDKGQSKYLNAKTRFVVDNFQNLRERNIDLPRPPRSQNRNNSRRWRENTNNNQQISSHPWWRIDGRLSRVSRSIFKRLCSFFWFS